MRRPNFKKLAFYLLLGWFSVVAGLYTANWGAERVLTYLNKIKPQAPWGKKLGAPWDDIIQGIYQYHGSYHNNDNIDPIPDLQNLNTNFLVEHNTVGGHTDITANKVDIAEGLTAAGGSFNVKGSGWGKGGFTTKGMMVSERDSGPGAAQRWALGTKVAGDDRYRFLINQSGAMSWGDGTNPRDTYLYRKTDDTLYTPDSLSMGRLITPYENTVTVAKSGADYTTIQEALDANPTSDTLFLVLPGTYINDTIDFTANNQTVRGLGLTANQIVTAADATIVNFGAYTGCRIDNIKMTMTNPTTAKDMITGSGSLSLRWCHLEVTNTTDTGADQPTCIDTTGNITMTYGTIKYVNSANSAGSIKVPIRLGEGAEIELRRVRIDIDGSTASFSTAVAFGTSTGTLTSYRCKIDVTDNDATYAVGSLYINAGSVVSYFRYNDVTVTNTGGTAVGAYLAGGTPTIRTTHNDIHVTGATANSFIVGAGTTAISQFDDIIAADGYTGAGTLTFVSSEADGDLTVSGTVIADTLTDGTFTATGGSVTGFTAGEDIDFNSYSALNLKSAMGVVNVKGFGAKGDGVTDDAAAINTAATYCRNNNKLLYFPKTGNSYLINSQIDLRDISVIMEDLQLGVSVNFAGTGILAGTTASSWFQGRLKLKVKREKDWTAGNIGIHLTNCRNCIMNLSADGFEKGIVLEGEDGKGFVYNEIHLGKILSCKYGLYLTTSGTGWINENLFCNGFWANAYEGAVACLYLTTADAPSKCEHNVFIKPSFEYANGISVIADSCENIYIENARVENMTQIASFQNNSKNNIITIGNYIAGKTWTDTTNTGRNYVVYSENKEHLLRSILEYTSFKYAWDDGTNTHIPGFSSIGYGVDSGEQSRARSNTFLEVVNGKGVKTDNVGSAVGVNVDTRKVKTFFVTTKPIEGYSKKLMPVVRCYDANGDVLTGTSPYYVTGYEITDGYGDFYDSGKTHSIQTSPSMIVFRDEVCSAFIGAGNPNYVSNVAASGLDILIFNYEGETPRVWLDYEGVKEYPPQRYSPNIPTKGTFARGIRLFKTSPSSGSPPGWVCTASGTMGTLAATTGDTVNGQPILTDLSQLVGLDVGCYLDVAGAYAGGDDYITSTIAAQASTTVDADSAVGQKVLNVLATTNFAVGETVIINRGGARQEIKVIDSIQDGVSLTLTENLTYTHTGVDADVVENCIVMNTNATATVNDAAVTYHNASWEPMQPIGTNAIPSTNLKTATGSASGILNNSGVNIVMHEMSFFPKTWSESSDMEFNCYYDPTTDPGGYIGRFYLWEEAAIDTSYTLAWHYLTASNNPQIWIVQNDQGQIITIWQAGDPPDEDNPFNPPLQYLHKDESYGILWYVEIPSFYDEFLVTLKKGLSEIEKKYKLTEITERPEGLPAHIKFGKLTKRPKVEEKVK